ncbi:MAG: protein kinase, partial [Lentisphaerota bacterium]
MPAKVTLKIVKGKDSGKTYPFDENDSLILGREEDCNVKLPEDTVSRYHCLMEITPPNVMVRDFGSLNGTYLNGKRIGQREDGMSAEEARKLKFNEFPMKDGDKLGLGPECEFISCIYTPVYCAGCLCELPESKSDRFEDTPGLFLCAKCQEMQKKRKVVIVKQKSSCIICGGQLDDNLGVGEKICTKCLKDPLLLLENLLKNAVVEKGDAAAIKGFRKIKLLGRGGMGEVWLVVEEATGKKMGLKLMLPRVAMEAKNRDRFLLEAKFAGELHHPNIIELYKSGCSDSTFFMLMEFCEGGSVDKLVEKHGGRLTPEIAVPIIIQLLDGLEYAHTVNIPEIKLKNGKTASANGLVHRDLSPQNIFLSDTSSSPVAKLADFGLAKAFETAGLTGNTRTGNVAG